MKMVLIPRSTKQNFMVFLGTGGFLAFSIFLIFYKNNKPLGLVFLILGLLVPFLFWISGAGETASIIINDEGIFDPRLGIGVIRWSDIEKAQLEVKYGNRYLCLRVSSPDRYINQLSGARREKVLQNRQIGFTFFNVDVQGIRVNLLEILKLIETKSINYRKDI